MPNTNQKRVRKKKLEKMRSVQKNEMEGDEEGEWIPVHSDCAPTKFQAVC